jgi:hypothetical protein
MRATRSFAVASGDHDVFAHQDVERREIAIAQRAGTDDLVGDESRGQRAEVVGVTGMLGDEGPRQRAAAALAVVDRDARNVGQRREELLRDAGAAVGRATGTGGHHDLHVLQRLPLLRRRGASRQRDGHNGAHCSNAMPCFHGPPPGLHEIRYGKLYHRKKLEGGRRKEEGKRQKAKGERREARGERRRTPT